MSAATCEARIDDKIVWQCPGVGKWSASAPYFSKQFGDEDTVIGNDSPEAK
jgi:hypothetical protein